MRIKIAFWLGLYLALHLGVASCSRGTGSTNGAGAPLSGQAAPETPSASAQQELAAVLKSARHADLQWPDFSDYSKWVNKFYEQGRRLEWSRGGKPTQQALEMIGLLENAEKKGLDSKDYDGEHWPARVEGLEASGARDESALVKFDVALTVSAMRYISDLHLGKVDPKTLHRDFDPERHKYDLAEFLRQQIAVAGSVKEALAGIEPPFPGYRRTLGALQKYLQMEKEEVPEPLTLVKKPVEPGQDYDELGKLARRLKFLGDLPAEANVLPGSQKYTGEVVEAVKSFQARHGLETGGKLGPQTIAELNRPMSARVEQLRLTLERWRWLPHDLGGPPIVVNSPEFVLRGYNEKYEMVLSMPVIVGKAMRTQTPVFMEEMKYVVFWPYWNVPPSILRNEIVPKIEKDPAYLQKNNYEVATYSGQVVTDGIVSEEVLAQLRAGKLMVRQKPGPKNALGLIKFIFPNDNNVYLHSTPSQGLFAKSRRDFSHGCIRVEDPAALAEWVLRNNPGWTKERIAAAFKTEKEQQVNLARPIPVLIVYGTAVVPEDGKARFFEDIYGFDRQLEKLFSQAYGSRK